MVYICARIKRLRLRICNKIKRYISYFKIIIMDFTKFSDKNFDKCSFFKTKRYKSKCRSKYYNF